MYVLIHVSFHLFCFIWFNLIHFHCLSGIAHAQWIQSIYNDMTQQAWEVREEERDRMTKGEGRARENTGRLFHTCTLVCGIEHNNVSHNQHLCLAARCTKSGHTLLQCTATDKMQLQSNSVMSVAWSSRSNLKQWPWTKILIITAFAYISFVEFIQKLRSKNGFTRGCVPDYFLVGSCNFLQPMSGGGSGDFRKCKRVI